MGSVLLYLGVAFLSVMFLGICQRAYRKDRVASVSLFIVGMVPIIVLYGIRYGIGADYYAYKTMYELLHKASFSEYWQYHILGYGDYYVELGYYVLNKISFHYVHLQFMLILLMSSILYIVLHKYDERMSEGLAVFIFFSTQFIYAMNGTRFIIAALFLLWAYTKINSGKKLEFVALIACAALFHKSALICIVFYVLKEFSGTKWNRLRNFSIMVGILFLPVIFQFSMEIMRRIPIFSRYFSAAIYAPASSMSEMGVTWLLHIVPVLLPVVILLAGKKHLPDTECRIFFRICCMEIPLRMLAFYNPWYGRLARYAQIGQCVFIPYYLGTIKSQRTKILLTFYYVMWYIFYFIYYILIVDEGHSIPYHMIF